MIGQGLVLLEVDFNWVLVDDKFFSILSNMLKQELLLIFRQDILEDVNEMSGIDSFCFSYSLELLSDAIVLFLSFLQVIVVRFIHE
jgi:hypothetical protein